MKGFVYILKSIRDEKQYIGSTTNIQRRIKEHNAGLVTSTKKRKPFVLKYLLEYADIKQAALMEKKFKRSHDVLRRELIQRGLVQR